jgi:YHS domain-containing protein
MKKFLLMTINWVLFNLIVQAQHGLFAPGEYAFDGNDLVSYFDSEKPIKGIEKYTYEYNGWKLQFANETNLKKFKANPKKYHPAYDGYCAIALTQGSLVKPDFSQFKIEEGELLFFEVRAFFNGRTAWEKNPQVNRIMADSKYQKLVIKPTN